MHEPIETKISVNENNYAIIEMDGYLIQEGQRGFTLYKVQANEEPSELQQTATLSAAIRICDSLAPVDEI